MTAKEFALKLLDEQNVACVPGSAFGACGEGFIRCSYAASFDNIKEAMVRMARFIEKTLTEKREPRSFTGLFRVNPCSSVAQSAMIEAKVLHELIVFPTELALRRFQQEDALKNGWVDASGHTTFSRLRKLCLTHAPVKGRRLDAARQLLVRREVIEVASGHFHEQGALGQLSENALRDVLDQLIKELASLPRDTSRVMDWLLDHAPLNKLYQLGTLISVWRATIKQEGFADSIDENLAILKLLAGPREKWPPLLRDCRQVTFRSIRWFNPFEELCVSALNKKLKIRVESALPHAHAEAAADRMGQRIRSEIMAEPWAVWAEDLGDAMAVDSADVLQLYDAPRINFSRSAGTYGEIEDLARRICWNLQTLDIPANRIALVVPNIGTVQDIIPHVFSRFKIPYFFRARPPPYSHRLA